MNKLDEAQRTWFGPTINEAQRTWAGPTDEEFARAIEAKLKDKNKHERR
jgi:hypothetical protein